MIAAKVSVVVGVALLVAAMLRSASAAARHATLVASVVVAAAMPLFAMVAPTWGAALLFSSMPAALATAEERTTAEWIWVAGAAIGLAHLAASVVAVALIRSRARLLVDPCWTTLVDEVAHEYGLTRSVRLFETTACQMPATIGLLRPLVLIPTAAHRWSVDQRRDVLRHELAHIKRGDWMLNLVVECVARLHWFNPLLWSARRRVRAESERACDDAVVNLGVDRRDYATHLADVVRALRRSAPLAASAIGSRGDLERRIVAVLTPSIDRAPLSPGAGASLAAIAIALALSIAGFGRPARPSAAGQLLDVQRSVLMRFGGEERRFSIAAQDVSFWRTRIQGRVELQARLNVDGTVSGVRVVEPVHPDLASAAETIVRSWRREPAVVRGVPVEVPIRLTVDFRR